MLSPRVKKILALLLAVLVTVSVGLWLRGHLKDRRALEQARQDIHATQAGLRLQAAQTLLRHDPLHAQARLIHAQEMFERGNFAVCRQDIEALPQDATAEQHFAGTLLATRSLIGQAQLAILNAPHRGVDTIAGQIEELFASATALRKIVESTPGQEETALTLQAAQIDVHALYLRSVLRAIHDNIDPTRSAVSTEQVQVLGVQTSDDQSELAVLESQLTEICQRILAINPQAAEPLALLFRQQLRQDRPDQARQTAMRLADSVEIPARLILSVVQELFDLEQRYLLEVTPQDITIAGKLLDRTPAADADRVEVRLAQAELALWRHQYEQADAILRQAMARPDYASHTHGLCLRGRALIGLGRHREAEQLLARLNDRQPTWEGKLIQGLAMQAERKQGLDLLRQAQELAPRSLAVRLAISQAIVDIGGLAVAELDIAELARMAPRHSQVMSLRLRLATHLGQRATIHEYLSRYDQPGQVALSADHVTLLAMMMLDDVQAVERLARSLHETHRRDPLALMGADWSSHPSIARAEAAHFAAQTLQAVLMADPMRQAHPPAFTALQRHRNAQALALLGQSEAGSSRAALAGSVYLAWPYEVAWQAVTAAHHRWPKDQGLMLAAARLALWLGRPDDVRHWMTLAKPLGHWPEGSLGNAIDAWLTGDQPRLEQALVASGMSGQGQLAASAPDWALLRMLAALRERHLMAVATELRTILAAHRRAEPALLWVARELAGDDDPSVLDTLISQLRSAEPDLVQMTQARLLIARSQPTDSTRSLNLVSTESLSDSVIRWQQAEIETIAARLRQQPLVALGALETLALSIPTQSPAIHLAEIDLMVDMGRDHTAASIIQQQLLTPPLWPSVWLDPLLARAMPLLEPARAIQILDQLLIDHPGHGLLLDYRTRLLMQLGLDSQADAALATLVGHHPQAPRTLMLQARHAMDRGHMAKARQWLTQVVEQGGPAAPVAQRELDQMLAIGQPALAPKEATP